MDELAKQPRRRIVMIAKIEADSWDRLSDELAHLSAEVDRGNLRSTSISGGYSCGHIIVASEDGSIDHDSWAKNLNEYLEQIRADESLNQRAAYRQAKGE
jgi:hypothetical protein